MSLSNLNFFKESNIKLYHLLHTSDGGCVFQINSPIELLHLESLVMANGYSVLSLSNDSVITNYPFERWQNLSNRFKTSNHNN